MKRGSFPNNQFRRLPPRASRLRSALPTQTERDDLEEAKARSLADNPGSSSTAYLDPSELDDDFEVDIAKAKRMSLRCAGQAHTPSGSDTPYETLYPLRGKVRKVASILDVAERDEVKVNTSSVVKLVRQWEGVVSKVLHSLKATEYQRMKDIKSHIEFDNDVEENLQTHLDRVTKSFEAKLAAKEEEWKRRLEKQKHQYEGHLAEQPLSIIVAHPRNTLSPSSSSAEVTALHNQLTTMAADHSASIASLNLVHASSQRVLSADIQLLHDENTTLRRALKGLKAPKSNESVEPATRTCESHSNEQSNDIATLEDGNALPGRRLANHQIRGRDGEGGKDESEQGVSQQIPVVKRRKKDTTCGLIEGWAAYSKKKRWKDEDRL